MAVPALAMAVAVCRSLGIPSGWCFHRGYPDPGYAEHDAVLGTGRFRPGLVAHHKLGQLRALVRLDLTDGRPRCQHGLALLVAHSARSMVPEPVAQIQSVTLRPGIFTMAEKQVEKSRLHLSQQADTKC